MRTLSLRELNRALLARQILLERKPLSVASAIERLAGLQAQWPPSPYIGLWTRLEGFHRETLERAVRRGDVLKPTVMRGTLHLITARDYPLFYAAFRETVFWGNRTHFEHATMLVRDLRALARRTPVSFSDALAHIRERGHEEVEARRILHQARRHAHLLHSRETAVWTSRPAATYEAVPEPKQVDVLAARTELVRRYLTAFGPATRADIADWSGLRVADFAPALEALEPLRRFRDEAGRELLDVPRAPLPDPATPAPVRFLPKWDNVLLGHADRRRVIADEHRRGVVGKNGDVASTVLVDGFVAALWRREAKSSRVIVEPLVPLSRSVSREIEEERARLEAWLP